MKERRPSGHRKKITKSSYDTLEKMNLLRDEIQEKKIDATNISNKSQDVGREADDGVRVMFNTARNAMTWFRHGIRRRLLGIDTVFGDVC